jgi:hypothetical protein
MLKIDRSKETSQTAVVTGTKQNKWGYSEQRHEASRHFRHKKQGYLKDITHQILITLCLHLSYTGVKK